MFRLSVDRYGVGVVCHPISDACRLIQCGSALVEVTDLEARACFDRPASGSSCPSSSWMRVVLPTPLGPMIPTLSPR